MRPHPRIRKSVKWTGAVVSVLLLAVWITSAWWYVSWWFRWGDSMAVGGGAAYVGHNILDIPPAARGAHYGLSTGTPFTWWFADYKYGAGGHMVIPLWSPVFLALLPTVAAWHLDTLTRRRAGVNLCPKCNYDRTGLAPGAVCPECGTAALARPPAAS